MATTACKAKLTIAADCRLGLHELRSARPPASATCARSASGALPEIAEVEPNNDFAAPQTIALNTTVNGVADNEDVDYFVVEAKKGERITAEVEGLRLGNTFFDPYVAILNAKRFELARSRRRAAGLAGLLRLDRRARRRQVHHPGPRDVVRRQRLVHLSPARGTLPAADGRLAAGGKPGETLGRPVARRRDRRREPRRSRCPAEAVRRRSASLPRTIRASPLRPTLSPVRPDQRARSGAEQRSGRRPRPSSALGRSTA